MSIEGRDSTFHTEVSIFCGPLRRAVFFLVEERCLENAKGVVLSLLIEGECVK